MIKSINSLVRFIAVVLTISTSFLLSCNDEDLKKSIDSLTEEVDNLKRINNLLELKSSVLERKANDILIKDILDLENDSLKIVYEDNTSLVLSSELVDSFTIDKDEWKVLFNFTDSTSVEVYFLGNDSIIPESSLVLNPFGNAPLAANMQFSTPVPGRFKFKVQGLDGEKSDFTGPIQNFTSDHNFNIIGLYPDHLNTIVLTFMNENGVERISKSITLETNKLPDGFPELKIVKQYIEIEPNVLFLINYRNINIPFLVDVFGRIRWYSTGFTKVSKYGLQRLKNGNIAFGRAGNGQGSIFEYSMLGQLVREYSFYPEFENAHHDVYEMPNGNFLVTVNKVGLSTVEDHIIELNRGSGQVTNVWDLRQILPMDRYTLTKIGDGSDWFHNNAVVYDESDNSIIVSDQAQGVAKITWDNELKWILAPHEGWDSEYTQYLLSPSNDTDFEWSWGQHAPCLMPNGNLLLFDNGFGRDFGNSTTQYSRAVEYKIVENSNQKGGTISQIWTFGKDQGISMFASFISDVDYLVDSDSRLITAGSLAYDLEYIDNLNNSIVPTTRPLNTRIIEVDNFGSILFEITLSSPVLGSTYRAEKLKFIN